ncbi:MAG: hypothetical protein AAB177_17820 [Nitrospirota bacterium]|jgi:hypothetical protein
MSAAEAPGQLELPGAEASAASLVLARLLESELLQVEMWMVSEILAFAKGLKKSVRPEGAEVDSVRRSLGPHYRR